MFRKYKDGDHVFLRISKRVENYASLCHSGPRDRQFKEAFPKIINSEITKADQSAFGMLPIKVLGMVVDYLAVVDKVYFALSSKVYAQIVFLKGVKLKLPIPALQPSNRNFSHQKAAL